MSKDENITRVISFSPVENGILIVPSDIKVIKSLLIDRGDDIPDVYRLFSFGEWLARQELTLEESIGPEVLIHFNSGVVKFESILTERFG